MEAILDAKQRLIKHRQDKVSTMALNALAVLVTTETPPPPVLNIVTRGEYVSLIGQITLEETYDPVGKALHYARQGVDAVSLFTDNRIYSKGLDDLLLVERALPHLPSIGQNYFLNEYHVTEARAVGASAVFIYSSLLDQATVRRLVSITTRWKMTPIVQVENEEQMDYAASISPHVIAVGCGLDFKPDCDLPMLERLASMVPYNSRFMPSGCIKKMKHLEAVLEFKPDAVVVDAILLDYYLDDVNNLLQRDPLMLE